MEAYQLLNTSAKLCEGLYIQSTNDSNAYDVSVFVSLFWSWFMHYQMLTKGSAEDMLGMHKWQITSSTEMH